MLARMWTKYTKQLIYKTQCPQTGGESKNPPLITKEQDKNAPAKSGYLACASHSKNAVWYANDRAHSSTIRESKNMATTSASAASAC
jgi:hypothetical protein